MISCPNESKSVLSTLEFIFISEESLFDFPISTIFSSALCSSFSLDLKAKIISSLNLKFLIVSFNSFLNFAFSLRSNSSFAWSSVMDVLATSFIS